MQVYLPLNSEATFAQTKGFSKAVAELLAREEPELVVARQTKSARAGKVLVDWGQNDVNKTTVSVYSLRAMRAPDGLDAGDLGRGPRDADPEDLTFEAADVLRRVDEHGDLFAPVRHACPAPAGGVACGAMALLAQAESPRCASPPRSAEPTCAERCLEVLCDPERAPAARLGEHEEAAIEAARRRWERALAAVSPRSSVVADQRDEAHLLEQLALQARRRAPGERQPLLRLGDRRDEPPAGRELGLELGQRLDAAGGGDVDGVERGALAAARASRRPPPASRSRTPAAARLRAARRESRAWRSIDHTCPARRASTAAW